MVSSSFTMTEVFLTDTLYEIYQDNSICVTDTGDPDADNSARSLSPILPMF